MNNFRMGVIVSRDDPLLLGRYRVRILGIHSAMEADLPNDQLPWATPINPITSSANSGIGWSPTAMVEGTWCVIIFADDNEQIPLILGTVAGQIDLNINQPSGVPVAEVLPPPVEPPVAPESAAPQEQPQTPPPSTGGALYLGNMTRGDYDKWKTGIGQVESGGVYSKQNTLGYSGKYQFGVAALEDGGYVKRGTWSRYGKNSILLDKTGKYDDIWTGKGGVSNIDAWLGNGSEQEAAMDVMAKRNYTFIARQTWYPKDPTKVTPQIQGGLMGVAHNQGPGGVTKLIKGQITADGYGTSSTKYYWYGYNATSSGTKDASHHGSVPTESSLLDGSTQTTTSTPDPEAAPPQAVVNGQSPYRAPAQATNAGKWAFADPNNVYPKVGMHGENDVNRLARGQYIDKTCVSEKEDTREKGIAIANSGVIWNQPPIPYAARYPFNQVYSSESGHVMEFDDTKGAERIHLYHTAGTFMEIDNIGNQTDKVNGVKVIIVDKDDLLYVKGNGHVNIAGDMTVRVAGQCQIEVGGDSNIVVHGNSYTTVDGEYNLSVKGNINMKSEGKINLVAADILSGDANEIHWNSGVSLDPTETPAYTPTVLEPSPPNRQEATVAAQEDTINHANPPADIAAAPPVTAGTADTAAPPPAVSAPTDCAGLTKPYSMNTQLSANYKLSQLSPVVPSDQGSGYTQDVCMCNLMSLAVNIIEPLRAKYAAKGFVINSCFRPGKVSSQHGRGEAVDIGFKPNGGKLSKQQYYEIAQEIKNSSLPYDQMLLEYRGSDQYWIHISHKKDGTQRRVVSTFVNDKNYGSYPSGLILVT